MSGPVCQACCGECPGCGRDLTVNAELLALLERLDTYLEKSGGKHPVAKHSGAHLDIKEAISRAKGGA